MSKYLTKSIKNCLRLKSRLYHFQLKGRISISNHINKYTKLLVDLTNLNVVIEDEDKALILFSFLSDEEYETFVFILIKNNTINQFLNIMVFQVKEIQI